VIETILQFCYQCKRAVVDQGFRVVLFVFQHLLKQCFFKILNFGTL